MPWVRFGDLFAMHPLVLRAGAARDADARTVNEVSGFVARCATQSGAYLTDYYVDRGTAQAMGGERTDILLAQAVEAGLLIPEGRGVKRRWRIVKDIDLIHLLLKQDVLFNRQRKRDNSNPRLTMPVRLRDGDQCRYCTHIVNWRDRRSSRGGTYDHVHAGEEATSPDDLVVSCKGCNSSRSNRDDADERRPLKPAPDRPYFSPENDSLEMLRKHYAGFPTHWIHTYINPTPAAESTGVSTEGHAQDESTTVGAEEAHAAAESTTTARHARDGREAHGCAEMTSGPRAEARPGAGSTADAVEAHGRPHRTAAERRRRRRAHAQPSTPQPDTDQPAPPV